MTTKSNATLENLLVWSAHRANTAGSCERKYYYNYIGSWEGWDTSAPPIVQEAYRLKHLTTLPLEVGQIIHRQIRSVFEKALSGRLIYPSTEIKITQEKFKAFLECSKRRRLEDLTAKRRKLLIHELGGSIGPKEVSGYLDRIEVQMNDFFAFTDVKTILADPSILLPDFLDPTNFDVTHELHVPARLRTDALFVDTNQIVICDWKCGCGGAKEDHRLQGLVYDIFARRRLALEASDPVEIRFYYLGTGKVEAHSFSDDDRSEMLWSVGEQFEALRTYSEDRRLNVGREERFHARVSGACFACNHHSMCPEFQGFKLSAGAKSVEN
jgi:hypothetical protein